MKWMRERRWFVLKRPRRDINGESETEVTVTSKQHAQRDRGIEMKSAFSPRERCGDHKRQKTDITVLVTMMFTLPREPDNREFGTNPTRQRGVGNQICWNKARFFKYTGTNAFSRIQKGAIPRDGIRAKTRRFPTYQDLVVIL